MDVAALVLFASTLLVAAASPGPGVAALVAQVVGRGSRGAGAFAAGLILGDLMWLAVAILGLAVVAQTFHEVFLVIKYAGAGYLAYLAYRMWTAPIRPRDVADDTRRDGYVRLFLAGPRSRWATRRLWRSISRCCRPSSTFRASACSATSSSPVSASSF